MLLSFSHIEVVARGSADVMAKDSAKRLLAENAATMKKHTIAIVVCNVRAGRSVRHRSE